MLYLLIIAPTYFVLRSWPYSWISQVFRGVPLVLQHTWYIFYIYY